MTTRRWRAPGRVNIIGEHIDYLGGTVLPFACDLELTITATDRDDDLINLTSADGDPEAYVRGVVEALLEADIETFGCEGEITSTIPVGAGLSSSAAIEAGIALAVTRGAVTTPEVLQHAEQLASGVRGGLMDQTAILYGRAGHAMALDCATGAIDHIAIPPDIGFVVIDTGTRRELAEGRYAQRREEVEAGQADRVRHAQTEQARVYAAIDALKAADIASLGSLISASHASLRDDFEVSAEALDDAVTKAEAHDACFGARLVGGGFAGCVLAVVNPARASDFVRTFDAAYAVRAVDGAGPA